MIVRNCSMFVVFGLCYLFLFAATAIAGEITDPILKKLVEKGVLTKQEAMSVMQDMEKDAVEQDKVVEKKIDKKVAEVAPAEGKDLGDVVKAMKGFKFGLLWYLSYMDGQGADVGGQAGDGVNHNRFAIKRGYFRVTKTFVPWFDAHMTLDVSQTKDDGSSLDGSVAVRIKYAYGKFKLPDVAFLTKPYFEAGIVHMPWLDFEEHVNFYRLQDTMFVERNKTFNSADFGVTFVSLLGGTMDEKYQHNVNHYYPGRYGSMAVGIYNGGGYHSSEKNGNKALEGRLTVRPLPDIVPGLQLSYFGIYGKGNKDTEPDWTVNLPFVSYEHKYVTLTGQYYWGKGNQGGSDENKKDGYSFFAEIKPTDKFSIIGRYDKFDPNTDADNDGNTRYIAGIAYHFYKQHKNMVLLDYDHVSYQDPSKQDDKRIQLTLQVAL